MEHFQFFLLLLACAVTIVALFQFIHLPPILGYLLVGMLMGPGGFGVIPSLHDLTFLAEFGVVFLMFTLGLDFSFTKLIAMKRALLGLGGIQVLLCTLVAMGGAIYFGFPPKTAFVAAGALALSSTVVVIKQLAVQHELHTIHGRFAIGILLFQDLAAVLFLILIPALAGSQEDTVLISWLQEKPESVTWLREALPFLFTPHIQSFLVSWLQEHALLVSLLYALFTGIGIFMVLLYLGKGPIRFLFHKVAKTHSNELFMLVALLVALGAAWITYGLGLSMALGAFLAGLILGETEFRHQIEIDMRPFRDVLLGLFFITIGALLHIKTLPQHWHWVLFILLALITFKTILIMLLTRIIEKQTFIKAFRTGLILAQGGEFGFVILTLAINNKLIDPEQSQVVIAAVVLSIVIAPLLIRYNKLIAYSLFKKPEETPPEEKNALPLDKQAMELKDHVIICGFGRVGQILARFLEQENIPSIALDLDPMRIGDTKVAGEKAFYGDARRLEVLAAAGLARARMIVISFADETAALETLKNIRSMRADIPVFVRTKNDSNLKAFQDAGATEVVPETLEASLMLASHLLLMLGVPASRILYKIRAIHTDRYRIMQGFFKGMDDQTLLEESDASRMSLHPLTVTENAFAVHKKIADIYDPESPHAIKALIRNGVRNPNPDPNLIIEAGDILVLLATPETLYILTEKILRGA